jgi:hypothetical protein
LDSGYASTCTMIKSWGSATLVINVDRPTTRAQTRTLKDDLEGTVPLDETTSRTETLEPSHMQPISLVYYDARPDIALGSLA